MAHAHDGLHFFGGGGQQHRLGQHPEHGEPVALVCAELLRLSDQTGRADDRAKFIEDSGFHVVLSYQSNQRGCREQQPRCETKSRPVRRPERTWNCVLIHRGKQSILINLFCATIRRIDTFRLTRPGAESCSLPPKWLRLTPRCQKSSRFVISASCLPRRTRKNPATSWREWRRARSVSGSRRSANSLIFRWRQSSSSH